VDRADAPVLEGVRVIEIGESVSAAFAGRWLAALGAELIWIEPPGGAAWRRDARGGPSSRLAYLGAGKRSAVADLADPEDRERVAKLLESAQLLLDGAGPGVLAGCGLAPWRDPARWPALASVSVTPYGDAGPLAHAPAASLALSAASGMAWFVGEPGQPPLAQWGDQPEHLTGLQAFGASLAALFAAAVAGGRTHYELSIQACAAAFVGHHTGRTSQMGFQPGRSALRSLWRAYPTRDGWATICALARNYPRLAEVTGLAEIAQATPFLDHQKRAAEEKRLREKISGWFAARSAEDVEKLGLAERVPLCRVASIPDVLESEQLHHRGFFASVEQPGIGRLRVPRQIWASAAHGWRSAPAPALDADQGVWLQRAESRAARSAPGFDPAAPLRGVRVLDLGQIWAGPYAATLLADQGADVIKVESPSAWDPNRCAAPPPAGREAQYWNTCSYFHEYSRNKRSLALDLRNPRGREILGKLVATADVVMENLRADVLDRLGIGYEFLRAHRPDVILVSMAAFGKSGPESVLPGYGPMIESLAGIASLTGYGDGTPRIASGYAYGDPIAASAGAAAALAALLVRARTGRGQHVDVAQRDAMAVLLGEAFVAASRGEPLAQHGNARAGCAPHGIYRCAGEDHWVAIAVQSDAQWQGLRRVLGDPGWARATELASAQGRVRRQRELDAQLEAWTAERDKLEVWRRCLEHGVPAGPVYKPLELIEDPQLRARDFYERIAHPAVGEWWIHGWSWPPRAAGPCMKRRAPDFGGENREILAELGFDDAEIDALLRDGVIAAVPQNLPSLS